MAGLCKSTFGVVIPQISGTLRCRIFLCMAGLCKSTFGLVIPQISGTSRCRIFLCGTRWGLLGGSPQTPERRQVRRESHVCFRRSTSGCFLLHQYRTCTTERRQVRRKCMSVSVVPHFADAKCNAGLFSTLQVFLFVQTNGRAVPIKKLHPKEDAVSILVMSKNFSSFSGSRGAFAKAPLARPLIPAVRRVRRGFRRRRGERRRRSSGK